MTITYIPMLHVVDLGLPKRTMEKGKDNGGIQRERQREELDGKMIDR